MAEFDQQPAHSRQDAFEALTRRRRVLADVATADRRVQVQLTQLNRESDRLRQQRRRATEASDTALCESIDRALTLCRQDIRGLEADRTVAAQTMAQATSEIVRLQAHIEAKGWG